MTNLSALSSAIRAVAPTMQELNDAILSLRGLPCYYLSLRTHSRPKPRRSRAKHRPTRLQRRRYPRQSEKPENRLNITREHGFLENTPTTTYTVKNQ